jgi:hypothetical protein
VPGRCGLFLTFFCLTRRAIGCGLVAGFPPVDATKVSALASGDFSGSVNDVGDIKMAAPAPAPSSVSTSRAGAPTFSSMERYDARYQECAGDGFRLLWESKCILEYERSVYHSRRSRFPQFGTTDNMTSQVFRAPLCRQGQFSSVVALPYRYHFM